MEDQATDYSDTHRMDFVHEVERDPATGKTRLCIRPDPRRYDLVEHNGEMYLFDRLDKLMIAETAVTRLVAEGLARGPVGEGQRLGSAREYITSRIPDIRSMLQGECSDGVPYAHVDHSDELLASLPDGAHGFAIVAVDLVGSTRLSEQLDPTTNARIVGLILHEIAAVVPYFDAHVLKFTGDGALLYLPPPSFNCANDKAIDCSLTIRGIFRDALNPILNEFEFPELDVRIGIESGSAVALTAGHPSSKQHRDLIGRAINMACKIQATGNSGEIRIGQVAYQNMHTMWKLGCERATQPSDWQFRFRDDRPYPVYLFVADGAVLKH